MYPLSACFSGSGASITILDILVNIVRIQRYFRDINITSSIAVSYLPPTDCMAARFAWTIRALLDSTMSRVNIAALAQCKLSPCRVDHDWLVNTVRAESPRLTSLARTILARPEAASWLDPLNGREQRWISPDGSAPDLAKLITLTSKLSSWER